ncbi:hypothetical protein L1987_09151 [Smallanthus sonchifolius]|uniref:Uncharacterized protein n=1 Tax=Smallanthus sonchifolius TaxID=185202 RepID=A0ACB9JP98_9ASTR|nr:hypothetical protein L1987_09151 [Smallanthus sonchifolius]
MEALKEIQTRFYKDFPPHPKEQTYGFASPSTMKPSQWSYVITKLNEYVEDLNKNIHKIPTRGPVSKYFLPDENHGGRIEISFDDTSSGVACNLESRGFHVLCQATKDAVGHVKPYSITGTLPLIRELQDEGFDVQTAGYGFDDCNCFEFLIVLKPSDSSLSSAKLSAKDLGDSTSYNELQALILV